MNILLYKFFHVWILEVDFSKKEHVKYREQTNAHKSIFIWRNHHRYKNLGISTFTHMKDLLKKRSKNKEKIPIR